MASLLWIWTTSRLLVAPIVCSWQCATPVTWETLQQATTQRMKKKTQPAHREKEEKNKGIHISRNACMHSCPHSVVSLLGVIRYVDQKRIILSGMPNTQLLNAFLYCLSISGGFCGGVCTTGLVYEVNHSAYAGCVSGIGALLLVLDRLRGGKSGGRPLPLIGEQELPTG